MFLRIKEQRILWKVFDNNLRKPKSIVICQQFLSPPVRSDRYAKIFPLRKLRITQAYYTLHSREVHFCWKWTRNEIQSKFFITLCQEGIKGHKCLILSCLWASLSCEVTGKRHAKTDAPHEDIAPNQEPITKKPHYSFLRIQEVLTYSLVLNKYWCVLNLWYWLVRFFIDSELPIIKEGK